jgi:hypothetical protein
VPQQDFRLTRNILDAIRFFEETAPERVQEIQAKLADYQNRLQQLGLKNEVFRETSKHNFVNAFLGALYLIVCFPVYLYGLINNYIPYIIPSKVARLITRDEVYIAPIMMTTGIFSFTICYALQVMWFHQVVTNSGWLTLAYAASLPPSGFIVLHYWNYFVSFYSIWNFSFLFKSRKNQISALLRARVGIMQALDKARKEYTAYIQSNRQGSLQGKQII